MNPIDGYASATSVSPGEAIDFHVRVEPPNTGFHIEVLRSGKDDVLLNDAGQAGPYPIPADASSNGCGWPVGYTLLVPNNWSSGVYVARLSTDQTASITEVVFVVKAAALGTNSKILFQLAVNTSQAYNNWGGKSLYGYNSAPNQQDGDRARKVSFDRPGIEGHGPDGQGSDSPFISYEYKFTRWLEMNGFEVEYCTSVDLHGDPHFLDNYQLLLSVGHDEYWSKEMRDSVETFVANGGNVAFFSGNVCWWQVRFENNNRTMVCYKSKDEDCLTGADNERVTVNWSAAPVGRPGNTMTGVDFRQGAYWKDGPIPTVDYQVKVPQHWIFDTALSGDTFGGDRRIIGYETDAAHLVDPNAAAPLPVGDDGTPPNFVCLAVANCQHWDESGGQNGWATMGLFHNNGLVFTAATVNWVGGLVNLDLPPGWGAVDQITQNLLRRLSCPCPPAPRLANASFEQYDGNGQPLNWSLEGAGSVGPGDVNIGHAPLQIDALKGQTWISQGPLLLEYRNYYVAGCWAKASQPGATIRLQSMLTWEDFAISEHPGDGDWHYLYAVGLPGINETPAFPARVKIQVAGGIAFFDNVQVEAIGPPPPRN
jgi:hypothetical protein